MKRAQPLQAELMDAPSLKPLNGTGGNKGGLSISHGEITGQLAKLKKVQRTPVDLPKKKENEVPVWAQKGN